MNPKIRLRIMSGVDDGSLHEFNADQDGTVNKDKWTLSIGRREENDVCLRNDTFVSRQHANLHHSRSNWWLEDCNSTNGTFLDNEQDFFDDIPVKGIVHLDDGQLFRVGRTWLTIQSVE